MNAVRRFFVSTSSWLTSSRMWHARRPSLPHLAAFRPTSTRLRTIFFRLSRAFSVHVTLHTFHVFGIMAQRFRILLKPIETSDRLADKIVKAVAVLHNYLIDESPATNPSAEGDTGPSDNGPLRQVVQTQPMSLQRRRGGRVNPDAESTRNNLIEYFNGGGSVAWQENQIAE